MPKAVLLAAALALPFSLNALAAKPVTGVSGPDFSGTYDCKGLDSHEGSYTGVVTLSRVPDQSAKGHDAYTFTLEVPGFGKYPGFAAARGTDMAIYFALTDPLPKDYGTGLAKFKKNKAGKWTFHKFYYEPEFKGGNYGEEDCVQTKPLQSHSTNENIKKSEALNETLINSFVASPDGINDFIRSYNNRISDLFIHKTSTGININFNFQRKPDGSTYMSSAPGSLRLVIALFDKNGNQITQFSSQEEFTVSQQYLSLDEYHKYRNITVTPLKEENNNISYDINTRDLRDTEAVGISFYYL